MTVRVDIVSDVVCPWCVVGWRQLAVASERTGVAIAPRWHPFQLNPHVGPKGENLRAHLMKKYGLTRAQSDANRARLTALGAEVGFAFDWFDDIRTHNTLRAHRLLRWAAERELDHPLKLALFDLYFARRGDPDDPAALADAAAAVGLDGDDAQAVLAGDRYAAEVEAEKRFWSENGVDGVPAMVFAQRHLVVGAQGVERYVAILGHLAEAG